MSAETCRRGHPRTAENIRVSKSDGRRRCRACEAFYSRKYWADHKREPRPRPTAADMAEDFEWLYLTNCGWGEILARLRFRSWDGVVQRLRDAGREDLVRIALDMGVPRKVRAA